jgi:predicted ATP-grasp superfamily ATP-dependent carboligase
MAVMEDKSSAGPGLLMSRSEERRPRVLVTDAAVRGTLTACRSLRDGGYAVDAVEASEPSPAITHWSRACGNRFLAPDPRGDRTGFSRALAQLLAREGYSILLPGSDAALLAISEYRDLFGDVRIGLPAHHDVLRALTKADMIEAAASTGFHAPDSIACETLSDAKRAAEDFGYPLVVKPWSSVSPDGAGIRQRGSRLVVSEVELVEVVFDDGLPVLLQRWVDGDVYSLAAIHAGGELLAPVFSRYERTWPPRAGSVSYSETLAFPQDLAAEVSALVSALGWEGIFELELVRDREGRYRPIDFNPRLYGSMALAESAGAPLAALWCDLLLGRQLPSVQSRTGIHYRWEEAEARNFLWRLRSGRFREAAGMMAPHRQTVHAHFQLTDPAPMLATVISISRMLWKRRQ